MAFTDWLPVASGTLLGLGGIYATLRAGKRQQTTALLVMQRQAEHQAALLREERAQRRLEPMYAELIQWGSETLDQALSVMGAYVEGHMGESMAPPEFALHIRDTMRLCPASHSYLWSRDVIRLVDQYQSRLNVVKAQLYDLWHKGQTRAYTSAMEPPDGYGMAAVEAIGYLGYALEDLRGQVRSELTGE